jgi:hypothetical protein
MYVGWGSGHVVTELLILNDGVFVVVLATFCYQKLGKSMNELFEEKKGRLMRAGARKVG